MATLKTVRKTSENVLFHAKLKTAHYDTPSCNGVEFQHDQPNGATFQIIR